MTDRFFITLKDSRTDIDATSQHQLLPGIAGAIVTGVLLLAAAGCSSSSSSDNAVAEPVSTTTPPPSPVSGTRQPFQELYDQGIDRHLGVIIGGPSATDGARSECRPR